MDMMVDSYAPVVTTHTVVRYNVSGQLLYRVCLELLNGGVFDQTLTLPLARLRQSGIEKPFRMEDIALTFENQFHDCGDSDGYLYLTLWLNKEGSVGMIEDPEITFAVSRFFRDKGLIPLPEDRYLRVSDELPKHYRERYELGGWLIPRDSSLTVCYAEFRADTQ